MAPKEDEDEVEAGKVRNENGNEATHGWHDGTLLPASFFCSKYEKNIHAFFLKGFFLSQNGLIKILFAQKTIHLVVQEQVEEKKKAKKCFACHKQCRAVCFSVSGAVYGTEQQKLGCKCTASAGIVINLNLYQGRRKRTSPSKVTIWQCYLWVGNAAVCAVSRSFRCFDGKSWTQT